MPNRGNAAVASTSVNKYPPIKAALHRGADTLDLDSLIRSIPDAQLRFVIAHVVAQISDCSQLG